MNLDTVREVIEELGGAAASGDRDSTRSAALPLAQDVGYALGMGATSGASTRALRDSRAAIHGAIERLGVGQDASSGVEGFALGLLFALDHVIEGYERGTEQSGRAEAAIEERAPLRTRVLEALRAGPLRPSQLVRTADADKYQISRALNDLEDGGLVERAPLRAGDDRRFRRYRLAEPAIAHPTLPDVDPSDIAEALEDTGAAEFIEPLLAHDDKSVRSAARRVLAAHEMAASSRSNR